MQLQVDSGCLGKSRDHRNEVLAVSCLGHLHLAAYVPTMIATFSVHLTETRYMEDPANTPRKHSAV